MALVLYDALLSLTFDQHLKYDEPATIDTYNHIHTLSCRKLSADPTLNDVPLNLEVDWGYLHLVCTYPLIRPTSIPLMIFNVASSPSEG